MRRIAQIPELAEAYDWSLMHGRAGNGRKRPGQPVGVPAPRLSCFATEFGIHSVEHPQMGKVGRLLVGSGDLQIEVHFPIEYAARLGTELAALDTGVVIARPDQLPKEPPA